MEEKKKRGRPKKLDKVVKKVGTGKRGRPPKKTPGSLNIGPKVKVLSDTGVDLSSSDVDVVITHDDVLPEELVEELYIPPKVERKILLIRLDKKVFHELNLMCGGDIIKVSYIIDNLMQQYIEKTNGFKIHKNETYAIWHSRTTGIEPLVIEEFARESAITAGVPLQYKYPILIDDVVMSKFQRITNGIIYYMYVLNELVKLYIDGKIKVTKGGISEWWVD